MIYLAIINVQDNSITNDLSRNNMLSFRCKISQEDLNPARISTALIPLLLDPLKDWVSLTWTQQFSNILVRA